MSSRSAARRSIRRWKTPPCCSAVSAFWFEDEAAELERQRVEALEEEVSDLRAEVHLLRGRLAEVEADVDARVAAARAGAEHARLGEARRQVAGFRLLSILEPGR